MKSKRAITLVEILVICAIVALLLVIIIPIFDHGDGSPSIACGFYLRQVAVGAYLYLQDYEMLPPRDSWTDVLQKYMVVTESFRCPSAPKEVRCSYAMNRYLPEFTDPNQLLPDLVMFFEIKGGWNVSGGAELLYFDNHNGRASVVFTDSHFEPITPEQADALRWKPE